MIKELNNQKFYKINKNTIFEEVGNESLLFRTSTKPCIIVLT